MSDMYISVYGRMKVSMRSVEVCLHNFDNHFKNDVETELIHSFHELQVFNISPTVS